MSVKPRPSLENWIELPKGQKIISAQPYRTLHKEYPKWKFWRNREVKYNIAIITEGNRVYLLEPDVPSIELKGETE